MTNCATTEKRHTDKGPGLKAISQRWTSESRVTDARRLTRPPVQRHNSVTCQHQTQVESEAH